MILLHGDIAVPIMLPEELSFFVELNTDKKYSVQGYSRLSDEQIAVKGLAPIQFGNGVDFEDFGGDGNADAVVNPPQEMPFFVLEGGGDELPIVETQELEGDGDLSKAFSTWRDMKEALASGDVDFAAEFFSPRVKNSYRSTFEVLRDELPEITSQLRQLKLVYSSHDVFVFAITRKLGVGQDVYFVTIAKQANGEWEIEAM